MTTSFLSGAITAASAAVALFFVRFWWQTSDRLFLLFGAAFALMAVERCILLAVSLEDEVRPYVYLVRFTAFLLILAGVVDKNRSAGRV